MVLVYIIIFVFSIGILFHVTTKKYLNPFKLVFVFGRKGSGKSTVLTKLAYTNLIKGKKVYSTESLSFRYKKYYYQTIKIDPRRIYEYHIPAGSIVLLDEVNTYWDNRDFKTMDKKVVMWFRYQRHYKVKVYLFSQTFDIDKKLRDLCDDMYLVTKFGRVLAIARHMIRKPVVVHPSAEAPARIDDDIIQDGLLLAPFGGCILAWIPKWSKSFDSFSDPHLYSTSNSSQDYLTPV